MSIETAVSGGCSGGLGIILCSPRGVAYRAILGCPVCKRRTRHTVLMMAWYGDDVTCLGCGNSWADGYRTTTKTQAKRDLAAARASWATATTRKAAFAWLRSELDYSDGAK